MNGNAAGAPRALLVLEDGRAFEGRSFGAAGETVAEVVFNTSLTGYQEVLSDPSYKGQIVVMTEPHIGNYGVCAADDESDGPKAAGFAVRELCAVPSSHRAEGDLSAYLRRRSVFGIEGIDTRALTRHLRTAGVLMGVVSTVDLDPARLAAKAAAAPKMAGLALAPDVSCREGYEWTEGTEGTGAAEPLPAWARGPGLRADCPPGKRVVVHDCGIKRSTLRRLVDLGCKVTVAPFTATAASILDLRPDGVVLSNGPGDPAATTHAVETAKGLLGRVPIFGICLGHQILGLALGARTFKLKFGHRGGNQPVKDLRTGRVYITSHNHGFAVDPTSLPAASGAEPWFVNLNDGTNEGLRAEGLRASSVQFHPEAAPGPNDCAFLFADFVRAL
jgi:carbamoyl-phosphate synthase small subunit